MNLSGARNSVRLNPALFLESCLERVADLFGYLIDAALDRVATAFFPIHLHPGSDDEPRRVVGGEHRYDPNAHTGSFIAGRAYVAGSDLAQTIRRHLKTFYRYFQFRFPGSKSDGNPLGGVALLDGEQRTLDD